MTPLRRSPSVGLLLGALLLLSSFGTGFAKAQSPAAGLVTLCIGALTVTVAVDAQGEPVAHGHLCPDCLAVAHCPGGGAPQAVRPETQAAPSPIAASQGGVRRAVCPPPARAPPEHLCL